MLWSGPGTNIPSLFLSISFHLPANLKGQLRQLGETNVFTGVKGAKDLLHRRLNPCYELLPASVQQPPAESQVSPVGLKVVAEGLSQLIIVILEADCRVGRGSSQRDNTREVVAAAKEVELDAGEDG